MADTCPKNHEKFVDYDVCLELINSLPTILVDSQADTSVIDHEARGEAENLIEKFRKVVDKYQEQPELLDPYLADLIKALTLGLDDFNISRLRYHTVFKFLYQLTKVIGFKKIVKKFPHETDKLPLLVELLSKEDPEDRFNWQTRYVLIVWLSIVIMNPFDLKKFDTDNSDISVSEKIYNTLMKSLSLYDSSQRVASYCLARFFSRDDVLKSGQEVDKFIDLTLEELKGVKFGIVNSSEDVKLIGYLRTLAYMFKFIPRNEMKARDGKILDVLINMDLDAINRELVNLLIVKLIQRAGLALLPGRAAAWRHKRGNRVLGAFELKEDGKNSLILPSSEYSVDDANAMGERMDDTTEESVSTERLEAIFSILIVAAHNSQTRVRWSASKGLGRLASRLSKERAKDVVELVISNFFDPITSNEYAWHSGCLTLAEMSRQGLVPEDKLADVTAIVSTAIIYDKIKGSFAVGAHVREAACYVCWALARTYEDHLLKPYISTISVSLLCTMLFDRELQCRRAASATFQELIGRQGVFEKEVISILTNVDYSSVGQRQMTYLDLALQVAGCRSENGEKYARPFVEHLIEKKIGHWDIQIRRLASDSLSALMLHCDSKFIAESVLPALIKSIEQDADISLKHGSILSLAKVISGLVPLGFEFEPRIAEFVASISGACEKLLASKQQAPNFLEAICLIIGCAEAAFLKFKPFALDGSIHQKQNDSDTQDEGFKILKQWENVAFMALDSDNALLRDLGTSAILTLYRSFFNGNKSHQDDIIVDLNKRLGSMNESSRCGALKAMSRLGQCCGSDSGKGDKNYQNIDYGKINTNSDLPDIILMSLVSYIGKPTNEGQDVVYAQAKAEACEAFVEFVHNMDKMRLSVMTSLLQAGYDALLEKTEDYTFDKRGDIGVVVRRAAIRAIQELTYHLLSIGVKSLFKSQSTVGKIISKTLQQCVSYNNTARELAGQSFHKLIGSELPDETIPHRAEILELFAKYKVEDDAFNWRDDSTPIFVSLLSKPEYNNDLWLGLVPSVGQASDLSAKQFREALAEHIQSLGPSSAANDSFFESYLEILEDKTIPDRLLNSGLTVADFLLTRGLLNNTSANFQTRFMDLIWGARRPKDIKRLLSVSRVMSSMLQFESESIKHQALIHCLDFLTNGFAKLREYTAEQLYLSIMTYLDEADEAMELLSSTTWTDPIDKIRPIRDEISLKLGIKKENLGKLPGAV